VLPREKSTIFSISNAHFPQGDLPKPIHRHNLNRQECAESRAFFAALRHKPETRHLQNVFLHVFPALFRTIFQFTVVRNCRFLIAWTKPIRTDVSVQQNQNGPRFAACDPL
jgi:hypothetical protein